MISSREHILQICEKSKGLSQGPEADIWEHAPAGFHLSLRVDRDVCEKFEPDLRRNAWSVENGMD